MYEVTIFFNINNEIQKKIYTTNKINFRETYIFFSDKFGKIQVWKNFNNIIIKEVGKDDFNDLL